MGQELSIIMVKINQGSLRIAGWRLFTIFYLVTIHWLSTFQLHTFIFELMKWTLQFSNFGQIHCCKLGFSQKSITVRQTEKIQNKRAVKSGSALFAQVTVLVCRDERVKYEINPFMPYGLFHHNYLARSIFNRRVLVSFYYCRVL